MNVRLFCPMNTTSLSLLCAAYTKQLVGAGAEVRLLPVRGLGNVMLGPSEWAPHEQLLVTALGWPFVNVVAGEPFDWYRLWTANVKNVVVALEAPPNGDQRVPTTGRMVGTAENERWSVARVAARYDAIIVPTEEISQTWAALGLAATVVPIESATGHELVAALT